MIDLGFRDGSVDARSSTAKLPSAYICGDSREREVIETRSQAWVAARVNFVGALLALAMTIVIGILNGLDVYVPDRDVLMGHVHAGTLGWITQALSGMTLLIFTADRSLSTEEMVRIRRLAWAVTGGVTLYVAAFFAGDGIPGDRIHRPVTGTILFVVLIWLLRWLLRARRDVVHTVARLGILLALVSLLIGAAVGILLGIYASRGAVPGISTTTGNAIAEAHPASLVIGFLLLAALAMIEWLLGDQPAFKSAAGVVQMWLLFFSGLVVSIAFVMRLENPFLGPANLAMIGGTAMMVVRHRRELTPSAWRHGGTGAYPRAAMLFVIAYLSLFTVIVLRITTGHMYFTPATPRDLGLLVAFDHVMFIGVMTNVLFGGLASAFHGKSWNLVDRTLLWGTNVGVAGFAVGLLLVEALPKRIFTPIMGTALLVGVGGYLREMTSRRAGSSVRSSGE